MYLALLRGINVGGKHKVEMPRLKLTFERLGHTGVSTYINSGNVIFTPARAASLPELVSELEAAIRQDFGFDVPVVLRTAAQVAEICARVPAAWTNDTGRKTDVMFLWENVDSPDTGKQFALKPGIEELIYAGGALVWSIERAHYGKSAVPKMVGTPLYASMTIRNINTVRKLRELMQVPSDRVQ